MKKSNALIIFILVLAVIAGIGYIYIEHTTDIGSIIENPDKYDKTGEIFVKYDGDLPAFGSNVKVTGIVRTNHFVWIAGKSWQKT